MKEDIQIEVRGRWNTPEVNNMLSLLDHHDIESSFIPIRCEARAYEIGTNKYIGRYGELLAYITDRNLRKIVVSP